MEIIKLACTIVTPGGETLTITADYLNQMAACMGLEVRGLKKGPAIGGGYVNNKLKVYGMNGQDEVRDTTRRSLTSAEEIAIAFDELAKREHGQ